MAFKVEDVPEEVMKVWVIQWSCKWSVGKKLYDECQEIIKKYPEWFPADQNEELPTNLNQPIKQ